MPDWEVVRGIVLRTFRFAPSLPRLSAWAPPAYGRGWPGSAGRYRLRPKHIRSIPPTPCGVGPARLRSRVARARRTISLTTRHISAPADSSRAVLNIHIQSLTIPIRPLPSRYSPGHPRTFPTFPPPVLHLCVQFIFLPAWDYLPSYALGPSAIAGMPFFK